MPAAETSWPTAKAPVLVATLATSSEPGPLSWALPVAFAASEILIEVAPTVVTVAPAGTPGPEIA